MSLEDYRCISVDCGDRSMFDVQDEVEKIVIEEEGKTDGGGAMIGGNVRDIFFWAKETQFKRIHKRVNENYKIVND